MFKKNDVVKLSHIEGYETYEGCTGKIVDFFEGGLVAIEMNIEIDGDRIFLCSVGEVGYV